MADTGLARTGEGETGADTGSGGAGSAFNLGDLAGLSFDPTRLLALTLKFLHLSFKKEKTQQENRRLEQVLTRNRSNSKARRRSRRGGDAP